MNNWGNPWQQAWYQQQPSHPHVYYPPQPYPARPQGPYWEQSQPWPGEAGRAPYYTASRKYPNLNPILAADTTLLRFDVRTRPNESIMTTTYHSSRFEPALRGTHVRLISKEFPWSIDIKNPPGSYVTCEAIWDAIYSSLKEPLADSEWGIVAGDKDRREAMQKAAKERERKDGEKRLKRIDWLGSKTMFKGLEKDEDFQKRRLLPGADECAETWVVLLGSG